MPQAREVGPPPTRRDRRRAAIPPARRSPVSPSAIGEHRTRRSTATVSACSASAGTARNRPNTRLTTSSPTCDERSSPPTAHRCGVEREVFLDLIEQVGAAAARTVDRLGVADERRCASRRPKHGFLGDRRRTDHCARLVSWTRRAGYGRPARRCGSRARRDGLGAASSQRSMRRRDRGQQEPRRRRTRRYCW